ncbi:MAG: GldG family protein [Candidatus Omnitrophica bacterium]|nr:GldG family protein [Candidatus Omnitrophota bacterium]
MMKQFFLKLQFLFWAVILFAIFAVAYWVVQPFSYRWDLTREKAYSLPRPTASVLRDLRGKKIEVLLFYDQNDKARRGLEVFLKECQRYHPDFRYDFYDPLRRPKIARQFNIRQPSTLVIRAGDREERLFQPDEDKFTNAFLRLLHPRDIHVCFVSGHGEAEIGGTEPNGFQKFRETLEGYNAKVHEIVLARDQVPEICQAVIVGGPRWELAAGELAGLDQAFKEGKGLLFLIDPMDPGASGSFRDLFATYGVELGENVIVDKVSRIVGGDFLMPLVSQYLPDHPVTKGLKHASFFPLVRTVQPSTDAPADLEVTPLAMTSDGSWAEADLKQLENGTAAFDVKSDVAGPLPIAVAVEPSQKAGPRGHMVVVGDSDFLTNGYLTLSGNKELGLNMIRWIARDDRFIDVKRPEFRFKPLTLDTRERARFMAVVLGIYPFAFFAITGIFFLIRSRTS